jgi:amino acid adenylation domain-containing protein
MSFVYRTVEKDGKASLAPVGFEDADLCSSVPARFARVMRCLPQGHLAYVGVEGTLTYKSLDQQSDYLAHALVMEMHGVPGGRKAVALLLPHNASSLIGVLGVLKAGHFYVPLAPELGMAYHARIVADCPPDMLVTTKALLPNAQNLLAPHHHVPILLVDDLPACRTVVPCAEEISPKTNAIILYTSGSTGQSRGVIRTHGQLLSAAYLSAKDIGISTTDKVAHLLSFAFAASTAILYGSLLNGATLHAIFPQNLAWSTLYQWLRQQQVTVMGSVPAVLRGLAELADDYPQLAAIRAVSVTGETISHQDVVCISRILSPGCRLVCVIGSTEVGTYARFIIVVGVPLKGEKIPVGYANEHVSLTITDEMGWPVEPNSKGQICVRGSYLSPGYWNRPDLTAARFLPDPDGGEKRIFLTGDLGRMTADGLLYHLGRKDNMIKIRGFRVEPESIETPLMTHPSLRECVVIARPSRGGESRLIAYIVQRQAPGPSVSELRKLLAQSLPSYMIPARFVFLRSLPRNINGKIDCLALPQPGVTRPDLDTPFVVPCGELEQQVADIWAELLELDEVGADDNFFELGGDSLTTLRMLLIIEERFCVTVPTEFFHNPTVAHLGRQISPEANIRSVQIDVRTLPSSKPIFKSNPWQFRLNNLLVQTGPIIRGRSLLPYGIGVRLQRVLLAIPQVQHTLFHRQIELLRCWSSLVGEQNLQEVIQKSLMANTWTGWRNNVLNQPIGTSPWVTVQGDTALWQARRKGPGVIFLVMHSPLTAIFLRGLAAGNSKMLFVRAKSDALEKYQEDRSLQIYRAYKALHRGEMVIIAGDGGKGKDGVTVPFLGGQRLFRQGGAELAVQTGAPLVPVFCMIAADGRITIEVDTPIAAGNGSVRAQVETMTRTYAELVTARWPRIYACLYWGGLERWLRKRDAGTL